MKNSVWKKKMNFTRRQFTALLVLLCLCALFCLWQNNDLTVSRYTYVSEKISTALDGYTVVQISDLHNKEFGKNQIKLLDAVKAEKPDLIVITGDIVDGFKTKLAPALDFVRGAAKIAPVYYVTGNHEEQMLSDSEREALYGGISDAGGIILNDETATVGRGGESFALIGINDISNGDTALLRKLADSVPENELKVLLAHEPHYFNSYVAGGADLVFSGHAHGGQIRLPFIGGLASPGEGWFPKYTAGKYTEGDTAMIVSRGLGNSIIPIRVFDRPDITVTVLRGVAG